MLVYFMIVLNLYLDIVPDEGFFFFLWHNWIWIRELNETKPICYEIIVNVFDFNIQHHSQLYSRRESLRIGSGLRSLSRPLLTLMQADHRLIMSPVFAQSLLHQMTRLPHVYLYQICREPEMRDGEGERRTRAIASLATLSLYPPSPGGQLPSPLTGAPPPSLYRSPSLSCATTPATSAPEYAISLSRNQGNIYTYKCSGRCKANIY